MEIKDSRMISLLRCRWGYRGVIIGWDEVARAPANWIQEMHKNNPSWQQQPNYAILVDTRDRPAPQITYVPQVSSWVELSTKFCVLPFKHLLSFQTYHTVNRM